MMQQSNPIVVDGIAIRSRMAGDCGSPGHIDPRCLKHFEQSESPNAQETDPQKKIALQREEMRKFTYNLNENPIKTLRVDVQTSEGVVSTYLYYPEKQNADSPLFLYVHGGAFLGGSVFNVDNICKYIAEKARCVVGAIEYTLPPETPYPIPTTQIYECVKYYHENADVYQFDAKKIFLGGDSAGGNMAASVALLDRDLKTHFLHGQILIYAKLLFDNNIAEGYQRDLHVFDLEEEEQKYLNQVTFIGSDASNLGDRERYVQGRCEMSNPYISPICGIQNDLPVTLMIQAEYDGLRLEGEHYFKQLKRHGVHAEMIRYCGVTHGFLDEMGYLPQAEAAALDIAAFITDNF